MKLKKRLGIVLCALVLILGTTTVLAADYRFNPSITESNIRTEFQYGHGGNLLRVEMRFTEYHPGSNHYHEDIDSHAVAGSATLVTKDRDALLGYRYIVMDAYAYVNGTEFTSMKGLKP